MSVAPSLPVVVSLIACLLAGGVTGGGGLASGVAPPDVCAEHLAPRNQHVHAPRHILALGEQRPGALVGCEPRRAGVRAAADVGEDPVVDGGGGLTLTHAPPPPRRSPRLRGGRGLGRRR